MKLLTTACVFLSLCSTAVHASDKEESKASAPVAGDTTKEAEKKEVEKSHPPEEVSKETASGSSAAGEYGKPQGLLGPLTIGPQLTFLGLPTVFRLGIEGRLFNFIGFGIEYGFVPTVTLSSVSLNLNSFQGTAKIFPTRGAFYLGVAVGNRNFSGTIPTTIAGTPVTLTGTASTAFITPLLGWKWVKPSGFFMGLDFGWQFALNASSTITSNPTALATAAAGTSEFTTLTNVLNSIGRASLPSMSSLQFGWLF